jgi:excisionase family DNA binding protein
MQNPPTQEWIAPGDAAKITGLSAQQIGRLADAGRISFTRPGKHRRYLRSDVEALLTPSAGGAAA